MDKDRNNGVPLVSVIMPVYNTAKYLWDSVGSILNQTLNSIELICVNDGSTDDSLNILNKLSEVDARISVYSQPNSGQGAARNLAFGYARGKYVYFMDSDDILSKDALEICSGIMESKELDILYFDGETFFDSPELAANFKNYQSVYNRPREYGDIVTGEAMFVRMHEDHCYLVSPCLQIIRKEVLQKKPFLEGARYEDNVFTMQTMLDAKRVSHLKEAFFKRRVRDNSTITAKKSFKDSRDVLVCALNASAYITTKEMSRSANAFATGEIRQMLYNAINWYRENDGTEKEIAEVFTPIEYEMFKRLCLERDRINILEEQKEASEAARDAVLESFSYRTGLFVTGIPRVLKNTMKRISKQNKTGDTFYYGR